MRIYNRALTRGEVAQLYHSGAANAGHSNAIISNGLVGYWTFDGPVTDWRTNTTQDVSGNGNTGTLVSLSTTTDRVAGKIGQALSFNGNNSYVHVPSSSSISLGSALTVSAWINPIDFNVVGGVSPRVVSKVDDSSNSYQLILSGATIFVEVQKSGVTTGLDTLSSITPGKWWHVVATWDGTNYVIYLNGAAQSSISENDATFTTETDMRIGARESTQHGNFHGTMDDVRIYNRALTAGEVKQLYLVGK